MLLKKWMLGGHNHDKCSFYLLPVVGNVLWSLSAKGMFIPIELHMYGRSQNVVAAWVSDKTLRPTRLQKRITSREELLSFSLNNPQIYGVHESTLHRVISAWRSLGKDLRT